MEAFKRQSAFWALFTEKGGDKDFRNTAMKKFGLHELLAQYKKVDKLIRRVSNLDSEVRTLQGMHKGRSLKRVRSEPSDGDA